MLERQGAGQRHVIASGPVPAVNPADLHRMVGEQSPPMFKFEGNSQPMHAGLIVHVSADFPDAFAPDKTRAIKTLVELVHDRFEQTVISLNRASPSAYEAFELLVKGRVAIDVARSNETLSALRYHAPGKGLLHMRALNSLATRVANEIERGPRPSLIVGHKLTVEGPVVARVSAMLGIPYALTVQGDTDTKILAMRPDLRNAYAGVLAGAAVVFSLAPWASDDMVRRLGVKPRRLISLPCPVARDAPITPAVGGHGLVTAFHLKSYRRKNLKGLLAGLRHAQRINPDISLDVIGGGSSREVAAVQRLADRCAHVTICGPVDNQNIPARFNRATAFAMPSKRESFGMVFIEALFSGCPVIYPRGRAIDGYFDRKPFAIAVDPANASEIGLALLRATSEERRMKASLAQWQQSVHAHQFRRHAIASTFAQGLQEAMGSGSHAHA